MKPNTFTLTTFIVSVSLVAGLLAGTGCRRRTTEVAEYKDPYPLPAEPQLKNAPTIGRHGGRFVLGQTVNPKTFNPLMATETIHRHHRRIFMVLPIRLMTPSNLPASRNLGWKMTA